MNDYHEEVLRTLETSDKEEIKEDEYIKTECPNCGNEMILPKWQFEKHKEDKDYYCSEGCRYNSETGHSAEEY